MWNLRKTERKKKKNKENKLIDLEKRLWLPEVGNMERIKQVNGIKRLTTAVTFKTNESLKCNAQHLDYS